MKREEIVDGRATGDIFIYGRLLKQGSNIQYEY